MLISKAPAGRLGAVVERIWLYEGEPPAHAWDLRLPTGRAELVINLEVPGTIGAGPFARAYRLDTAEQSHVMGVVLRPGRARALLGVPLSELRERHVELEDLWGPAAGQLRERLLAAPDPIFELEAALCRRLAGSSELAHPFAAAAAARASEGVGPLAERLGWTTRRLEQVFRADVGLTPKAYQRLHRFRSALVGIDRAAVVGWPAFALERGYYDQAHFIREFRAHAGLSPTAYLARRGAQLNHVPVA